MTTREAGVRLQLLHAAVDELILTTTGLSVLPQSRPLDDNPPDSFTMRLVGGGSPEVRLRIHETTAVLIARSGTDHQSAGKAEIRDDLGVRLETGFAWNDSVCSSANELAGLLLKHMRRRLKAVAEVTPDGST
ncbi:MAG: hypothetical protein ACJ8GN_16755 [Longimicrobiaceae bacterium]